MSGGIETAASYVDEDEKATFRQKSPQASERTKQRIKEKSCWLQKRVSGLPSDETPQIDPVQPRASHPSCQATPTEPDCCADVP